MTAQWSAPAPQSSVSRTSPSVRGVARRSRTCAYRAEGNTTSGIGAKERFALKSASKSTWRGCSASSTASGCQPSESSSARALACTSIPARVMNRCSTCGTLPPPRPASDSEPISRRTAPLAALRLQVGGGLETFTVPVAPPEFQVKAKQELLQPAKANEEQDKARKPKIASESPR